MGTSCACFSGNLDVKCSRAQTSSSSTDGLEVKLLKTLGGDVNALMLTSLPRSVNALSLIPKFYGSMSCNNMNRSFGMVNFTDTSTRDAFVMSIPCMESMLIERLE